MTTGHDDIKQIMFNAFIVVQKMEVPYSVKNKMFGAIFSMNPNPWRVVHAKNSA